jgi:hypothetical protein
VKRQDRIAGLTSIALIGGLLATSAAAFEIRRGEWEATVDLIYFDASPVTKKAHKTVDDLEDQLRRLGVRPEPRPPEEKRFTYTIKECVPPSSQGLGWIDLQDIIQTTNWTCSVTNRRDLGSTIYIDFICPEDGAKGSLRLNFTTDSSVVGDFERTSMSGSTLFERATIQGGLTQGNVQCETPVP